jgi:hypothetical protein
MGAYRIGRQVGRGTAGFAGFAAMCCLVWGLPAAAQASSSPPEVQTEPAEPLPGGAKLEGKVSPGGLPTTYYFEYASVTCDEGCTPTKTAKSGPLTGDTMQEVPAVEVTGLSAGSERYWYRLIAHNADGTVDGEFVNFTPGAALPLIDSESVSNITSTDATLEAKINPEGQAVRYQFQLVLSPSEYRSEVVCPPNPGPPFICTGEHVTNALPLGFIQSGSEDQPVSLDLASTGVTLQPGTTYHYRVIAAKSVQTEDTITWQGPPVYGTDQTFTTSPTAAPVIESETASNITSTDATLQAQINPGGLETTYEVWVGTVGCIEEGGPANTCESTGKSEIVGTIPTGTSPQTVSVGIAKAWHKLAPNALYVFSVSASNSAGKGSGNYKIFRTAVASAPSIETESVSHLTPTDATLEAQINTEGLETTYNFYLQEAPLCFKAVPPCERPQHEPIALPAGTLLGSFVGQSVSVELNSAGVSLAPGEHYEYWVTATSAAGTTTGHAQEFTAPEEKAQPLNTTTPSTTNGNNQGTSSTPTGSGGSPAPGVTPLGPQIVCLCNCARGCHGKKVSPKHLTRTQKLSKALKACAKKPKRKRAACQKQAREKYATTASKAKKR